RVVYPTGGGTRGRHLPADPHGRGPRDRAEPAGRREPGHPRAARSRPPQAARRTPGETHQEVRRHIPTVLTHLQMPPPYPFDGRRFAQAGLGLHYLDEGAGDPVVMLHGNPTWSFYYRNLVLSLRDSYRCVVPDHIGCGLSDKPPESLYDYSLKSRIDDVAALLDHLGLRENLTLVLHDWGGMIGMAVATRHPNPIMPLIVSNTGACPLPNSKSFPWQLWLGRNTRLGAWLILKQNAFCRAAASWCVTRKKLPADVRAMYLKPYDSPEHRVA